MLNVEIIEILNKLSKTRPVFHNEADFQFSFAWEIQKQISNSSIRLEYKVPGFVNRYTDIWVNGKSPIAIELKYKPISTRLEINKEIFELKKHGAEDIGRYDYLKDVQRVEEIVMKYPKTVGYAILLSNDHLYWNLPYKQDSVDASFKIHEGRRVHGNLPWASNTGVGTKKNREESIVIKGEYDINWKSYSIINQKGGEFRTLCLKVTSSGLYHHYG